MTPTTKESTAKITGVSETLMITLYGRYLDAKHFDSILRDRKAIEIVENIDYDFTKFDLGWKSLLGSCVRSQQFDVLVSEFIQQHPQAIIINLASGLCSRFDRLDNGTITWYEVDFAEVIELRRKFFTETERYKFIGQSIFDFSWMDIITEDTNQPVLIIAEGLSMYLTESSHQILFRQLSNRFTSAEMMMDMVSPGIAKNTKRHGTVSKVNAEFKWGISDPQEIEKWGVGVRVLKIYYYLTNFDVFVTQLPQWWMKYLVYFVVPFVKNQSRLVRFEI